MLLGAVVQEVSPIAWFAALIILAVLLGLSAFCCASEAALFSLTAHQRMKLDATKSADRAIEYLLTHATHLLTCILLCNLVINITFFSVANVVASWSDFENAWPGWAVVQAFASVGLVILFGELLPKSLGVLAPVRISRFIALPMFWIMRSILPLVKGMHAINDICRRLIWPGLVPESVLETADLERAIELSETDSNRIDLEKGMLQNILQTSSIQAQEWMRPKSQFKSITIPAPTEDIQAFIDEEMSESFGPYGDLVLIFSHFENEIAATTSFDQLRQAAATGKSPTCQPALYVPWCANLARVLQQLLRLDAKVAIVVNERGDSIGVLFFEDILESIFGSPTNASTTGRPLFAKTGETKWEVTGSTRIRQLERSLGVRLPETRDATIAGVLQSQLRRVAQVGDRVEWGPFTFQVIEAPRRGELFVEITSSEIDISKSEDGGTE